MSSHRGYKIAMLRVLNDEMAGTLADLEAVGDIEASKIGLTPSEWSPSDACQKLAARVHRATLALASRVENASSWIQPRDRKRSVDG